MMGRRVLVTGLGSFWGGRLAQALEADPEVELIVGLDTHDPTVKLGRTEFVRTDEGYSILARLVQATQIDTILHTFLIVDSTRMSGRAMHEINVIGTMNLLAAAGAPDSSVRHLVVKSSALVYGASYRDPAWFREDMTRNGPAKTRVEKTLLEAESYLQDFAAETPQVTVTVLRCANVLGAALVTPISRALSLPAVPCLFGFDPLLQFVEENDVVRALEFAMRADLSGVYNLAGDGRLPWSEVTAMVGKLPWPLPPAMTSLGTVPLARLGLVDLPPELLALLRFGRGIDNRRLKEAGFDYTCTTVDAVDRFRKANRVRSLKRPEPSYRYDGDVEAFFQRSKAIVRDF
jgi:UDP-glucose 4-epimerase